MDEPRFDLDQVRAIIALAEEADLAELTVESSDLKISVRRGAPAQSAAAPASAREALRPPAPAPMEEVHAAAASAQGALDNHVQPITAPMVGTFYRAANPDAAPFVEEGDVVEPGQTVCIIEAMKLFNEIQSELRGRVVRVLAENGAPVEYGQPLFLIDPRRNGA